MLFTFLTVIHAIVAALLVIVILMQRSEGGGLTSSGSPSGLMSARGAADFLTRSTAVLASVFVALSIALAFVAATRGATSIDTSLQRTAPAASKAAVPATGDALPAPVQNASGITPLPVTGPGTGQDNGVPLAN